MAKDGMAYEATPVKTSKDAGKRYAQKELDRVGTFALLWHVVKRHKFGLVASWALIVTIMHFVPFAFDMLFAVFQ